MISGKIHSIETFGTVDGPGTRFVVFFQGCNLRCKYCHNPDTWKLSDSKIELTAQDLLEEYKKVEEFITGGITITGGEPLFQIDFLIEVVKKFKENNIHVCIDSSGNIFRKNNEIIINKMNELFKYVDLVLLDIKHIKSDKHKELVGIYNENILDFAIYLSEKKIPVWIRHVVVPGYTLNESYLYELGKFVANLNNVDGIEVLPYHEMGRIKYDLLNIKYPLENVCDATNDEAIRARKIILFAMNKYKGIKKI